MSENRKLAAILVSDATNRLFGHRSRIVKRNADRHRSKSSFFAPFASRLAAKSRRNALSVAHAPSGGEGADRNDRRDGSEQWIT